MTNIISWNQFYQRELNNFEHNEDDTGECWFDDSDAELKMIDFIIQKMNDKDIDFQTINFLDLGTGNGHLLFLLFEELQEECDDINDIVVNFKGIDYSPDSVSFATKIYNSKYSEGPFSFDQVDLLVKNGQFLIDNRSKYDILFDKGTLDAIALNQDPLSGFEGKTGMEVYPEQVSQLMHSGSILLITSCNFTEEELITIMGANNEFSVWSKIEYPTFQFGGVKGATICSVAFIKQ